MSKNHYFSDEFSGLIGARRKSSLGEDEKNEIARENGIEFEIVGNTLNNGQKKQSIDEEFFKSLSSSKD